MNPPFKDGGVVLRSIFSACDIRMCDPYMEAEFGRDDRCLTSFWKKIYIWIESFMKSNYFTACCYWGSRTSLLVVRIVRIPDP